MNFDQFLHEIVMKLRFLSAVFQKSDRSCRGTSLKDFQTTGTCSGGVSYPHTNVV